MLDAWSTVASVKARALMILMLLAAGCQAQPAAPPRSELDQWVLDQAAHCEIWGRPTEEAERMGIPITDCDYYIEEAENIRSR